MSRTKLALCVALTLAAANAVAEEAVLDEVLVLGSKLEESLPQALSEYGNRLEVITAEQIQAGGFTDVSQVLQMLVPGLYVAGKNGPFDYVEVSLQGSRRSDILWLIDGVRISNRLYNTTTPLDTIPASMIERIEVLKGGQGLFYGTQSVAGVINVVTKGFSQDLDIGAGVGFNTNSASHYDAYVRNSFGGTSFVGYASLDTADGFLPYRNIDIQPSTTQRRRGYDVRNVGAKLGHEFGNSIATTLQYQYTDAELDFAGPHRTREKFNERSEHILSGKFDYTITDSLSVFLKGYYHEWTTHYTQIDNTPITLTPVVISNAEFWGYKDFGVNLLGQYTFVPGLDLLAGFDQQRFNARDEVLKIAQKSERVNAYFATLRTGPELIPRTHFSLGARYNDPMDGEEKSVWNASGQVDIFDSLYVRALGGTAFRLPDAYELYAIDENDVLGNPNLKPESSTSYEGAIGGNVGNGLFGWEAIAFWRKVRDIITDDGVAFINGTDEIEVSGFEIVLNAVFNESWSASTDYTYNKVQFKDSDQQLVRIPKRTAKVKLDYSTSDGVFGAGVAGAYVGEMTQNVSGVGVGTYGNYWVFDLTGYQFLDDAKRHRLALRFENALGRQYASSLTRGLQDNNGAPYRVDNLGVPRTFHLNYDYRFGGR